MHLISRSSGHLGRRILHAFQSKTSLPCFGSAAPWPSLQWVSIRRRHDADRHQSGHETLQQATRSARGAPREHERGSERRSDLRTKTQRRPRRKPDDSKHHERSSPFHETTQFGTWRPPFVEKYREITSAKRLAATVRSTLDAITPILTDDTFLARLKFEPEDLQLRWDAYAQKMKEYVDVSEQTLLDKVKIYRDEELKVSALLQKFQAAIKQDQGALDYQLKLGFMAEIIMGRYSSEELARQAKIADLRYPTEWFPATRGMRRVFHMHVGPTNSGKTYQALKRLEQAKTGIYAGPLRLLAQEVFMRLGAKGRRCELLTGDERKATDDANGPADIIASTVEMTPLDNKVDVAVIDEIQMLGSEDRGWAWTQAVLGVQAREIHVCGEERTVPIVRELAALCGDAFHLHTYNRLSPLLMMKKSLDGDVFELMKGDCVVCFSIDAIHALRQLIEKSLKSKVAIIYGALPPETRAQQAKLFNDPDNDYDILVASDAVGMGLNLNIRRIVFQSAVKMVKGKLSGIPVHEVKQIAGRAGRFSTAEKDIRSSSAEPGAETGLDVSPARKSGNPQAKPPVGLVTTFEAFDFNRISKAMKSEPDPIVSAGTLAPSYLIRKFAQQFPSRTPLSLILERIHEIASNHSRLHLCDLRSMISIADSIEEVDNLSLSERLVVISAPAEPRKPGEAAFLRQCAEVIAERKATTILDIPHLNLELLENESTVDRRYLMDLEALHKSLVTWLWLSYRFERNFQERHLAAHVKSLLEKRIEDTIAQLSFSYADLRVSNQAAAGMLFPEQGHSDTDSEGDDGEEADFAAREDAAFEREAAR